MDGTFGKNPSTNEIASRKLLRRRDIANFFGVTERTILRWETKYGFPAPARIGRTAFWQPADLENFTAARIAEREALK